MKAFIPTLAILCAGCVYTTPTTTTAPTVETVKTSSYEWSCLDAAGKVLKGSTSQNDVFEYCANRALAEPGIKFKISGGQYTVTGSGGSAPPPEEECPAQPADESRSQACPAGTTGTWSQSKAYTPAEYPTCWVATEWMPSAPPAGACPPVSGGGRVITAVSCKATDIQSAINQAAAGDTVAVPAGTCSWSGSGINVAKPITVAGAGKASTLINWNGVGEALKISGSDAVVKDISITATSSPSGSMVFIDADACNIRITASKFDMKNFAAGLIFNQPYMNSSCGGKTFGLVDSSEFVGLNGERGFTRGPCDAWKTKTRVGTAANLFFEDNVFIASNSAYFDFNANAQVVVRYNTVTNVYFDGHGSWSNSDLCNRSGGTERHRGIRAMEVYNNTWTTASNFRAVYPRGGSGVIFGNRIQNASNKSAQMVFLDEYCAREDDRGWCHQKSCPSASTGPLRDQIGRGMDKVSGTPGDGEGQQAAEPLLIWDNKYSDGTPMYLVPEDDSGFGDAGCAGGANMRSFLVAGRDYCEAAAKPTTCNGVATTYTPYAYPHPMRAGAR